jgi:Fe(3+) dicitrate transport protein
LFSGVHKGFSPPTFGTSFNNLGEDFRLRPETSTNYEMGVRGDLANYLYLEIVGYKMFFRDQIVNVQEINDGRGSRPQNTGFSTHTGGELVSAFDFGKFMNWDWKFPLEIIYSHINAKNHSYELVQYTEDEFKRIQIVERPLFIVNNYQIISSNTSGNYLPYVPKHTMTLSVGFDSNSGYYGRTEYQYIDKQFSDLDNTKDESFDGNVGVIPKIGLWNASFGYRSKDKWSVFINGKNLQDRRYVSGRLPIGIHPGPFRQINFGISFEL